jgi:hypothetical protein
MRNNKFLEVMKMEEKMEVLEGMVEGISKFCGENKIEYVFAAVADEGKHTLLSHSTLANNILKESAKIIKTLTGK